MEVHDSQGHTGNGAQLARGGYTRHARIIDGLPAKFPEVRLSGFQRCVREIFGPEGAAEFKEHIDAVRPDAFAVHPDLQEIIVFEVECAHRLTEEKILRYLGLYYALDECEWTLGLIRVSSWGECYYCNIPMSAIQIEYEQDRDKSGAARPRPVKIKRQGPPPAKPKKLRLVPGKHRRMDNHPSTVGPIVVHLTGIHRRAITVAHKRHTRVLLTSIRP